ncbi:hypothetical protein D3C77_391320 [compost metagenome]
MKKIAIRPSLTQWAIDSPATLTWRVEKYTAAHGELATISAASAAAMRMTPLADSAAKKRVRKAREEGDWPNGRVCCGREESRLIGMATPRGGPTCAEFNLPCRGIAVAPRGGILHKSCGGR